MKKKILFITPSLARTGSEMVLWHLLNHLDSNQFTPYVFCLRRGELFDQLPSGMEKSLAYRNSGCWYKKAFRGILKMFGIEPIAYQLQQIQRKFGADLWYVNTILIPQAPLTAKKLHINVATHIHELLYAFSFIKAKEFESIINYSNTLIGSSSLVCEQLGQLGHPRIKLQNSFIDEQTILPNLQHTQQLKEKLGIKETDFVWVISGTVAYMKGIDTLLELLEIFKNEAVKFVWIGGIQNTGLDTYVQKVVEKKYQGQMIFTGAVSADYYDYLSLANALLLPSKEESFSLVMLEAAYLGIPIVAFNVGIAGSFIKDGMGKVVKSWNTTDMAAAMTALHQNPNTAKELLKSASLEFTLSRQLIPFQQLLSEL